MKKISVLLLFVLILPKVCSLSGTAAGGGIIMEQVMLSVEDNMNNNGAVKVHIVIVYDKELVTELMKMSSEDYFRNIQQLIKDHPDKLKIFEWELVAKKRIIPRTDIKYPTDHLIPLTAFVFANYHSTGEHRAKIPPTYKKIKITFEKDNFKIDYEDKDE